MDRHPCTAASRKQDAYKYRSRSRATLLYAMRNCGVLWPCFCSTLYSYTVLFYCSCTTYKGAREWSEFERGVGGGGLLNTTTQLNERIGLPVVGSIGSRTIINRLIALTIFPFECSVFPGRYFGPTHVVIAFLLLLGIYSFICVPSTYHF